MLRQTSAFAALAALWVLAPAAASASLVFYMDSTSFNAAAPGLPVQDFPTTNPAQITPPLNGATNDGIFSPGDVLSGISFSTSSGNLYLFDGALSTFTFAVTLKVNFTPGISSVGFDYFGSTGSPGGGKAGNLTAHLFNGATSLGSDTVSDVANTTAFFGVTSTSANITELDITFEATCGTPGCDAGDANAFIDNVAFGTPVTPIPEPMSLTMFLSAVGMFGALRWHVRSGHARSAGRH